MEEKINFSQVPHQYTLCLRRECAKAGTCLRQLAEQCVPADIQHWTIISPKYLATLSDTGDDCPHYRSSAKVRFAKGFIQILENLPYRQMQTVVSRLTGAFGQRTYYRVRKGERLLSPAEQKRLLQILKKCGVPLPQQFDAYEEYYDW